MGDDEILVGEVLMGAPRYKIFVSVKGPAGGLLGHARPQAHPVKHLGLDYIDIYRPARIDLDAPIEGTAAMVKTGYVRHIGLSEARSLRRTPMRRGGPLDGRQSATSRSVISRGGSRCARIHKLRIVGRPRVICAGFCGSAHLYEVMPILYDECETGLLGAPQMTSYDIRKVRPS